MDVIHVEDLTGHYVLTLERWIDNVRRNRLLGPRTIGGHA